MKIIKILQKQQQGTNLYFYIGMDVAGEWGKSIADQICLQTESNLIF